MRSKKPVSPLKTKTHRPCGGSGGRDLCLKSRRWALIFDDLPAAGIRQLFSLPLGFVARCEPDCQGARDVYVPVSEIGVLSGGAKDVLPVFFQ